MSNAALMRFIPPATKGTEAAVPSGNVMKSNEHRKNERHAHPTLGIDVITNGHAFGNVMERDSACDDHTSNPEFAFGRMLFQVLIVMIDMAQFINVVMGL